MTLHASFSKYVRKIIAGNLIGISISSKILINPDFHGHQDDGVIIISIALLISFCSSQSNFLKELFAILNHCAVRKTQKACSPNFSPMKDMVSRKLNINRN